jgi:type IV pilus assembly protein PilB
MVGEIRDGETAEIAIRAALTGHLVFSTLHTNDAPSSINRLIDMGIPNYLVASATKMIMAQRMAKKICPNCKEETKLSAEQIDALNIPDELKKDMRAFRGKGCSECGETGRMGRTAIFEVMPITPDIEQLILARSTDVEIRKQALKEGMYTLRMAAVQKMNDGVIPYDEVLAITA